MENLDFNFRRFKEQQLFIIDRIDAATNIYEIDYCKELIECFLTINTDYFKSKKNWQEYVFLIQKLGARENELF